LLEIRDVRALWLFGEEEEEEEEEGIYIYIYRYLYIPAPSITTRRKLISYIPHPCIPSTQPPSILPPPPPHPSPPRLLHTFSTKARSSCFPSLRNYKTETWMYAELMYVLKFSPAG